LWPNNLIHREGCSCFEFSGFFSSEAHLALLTQCAYIIEGKFSSFGDLRRRAVVSEGRRIIRVQRLKEQKDEKPENTTAVERLQMMWQIAQDTWAFTGEKIAQSRLQRHLVSIRRPER
jgi:hypothetical protein